MAQDGGRAVGYGRAMTEPAPVVLINVYRCEPERMDTLMELVGVMVRAQREAEGFISATLHRGLNGKVAAVHAGRGGSVARRALPAGTGGGGVVVHPDREDMQHRQRWTPLRRRREDPRAAVGERQGVAAVVAGALAGQRAPHVHVVGAGDVARLIFGARVAIRLEEFRRIDDPQVRCPQFAFQPVG